MTAEDAKHWETAVLIRFGTAYGLLLAEGNDEDDEFCESAKELKADSETPNRVQGRLSFRGRGCGASPGALAAGAASYISASEHSSLCPSAQT